MEIPRTSVVEGRRELPSGHQEKHPPWGSMTMGVGIKQNPQEMEGFQISRFRIAVSVVPCAV